MSQLAEQRKEAALKFIVAYKANHGGNSPTFREIGEHLKICSTSLIAFYIQRLIEEGYLSRGPAGVTRCLTVLKSTYVSLETPIHER